MATWNADNTVITKKGNEILSKVQSGNGAITVSRIVTGAGYVSASQLYAQTVVTNIKQEMTITGNRASENGSTLDLRVDNSALAEGYPMYQIGIYVTHPDYTGEVLYLIAQIADTAHPDSIPALSEGVIGFNFSLYMEHAGTSNVVITVNPAGSASIEDFNALKESIVYISERDEALTPILENARVYTTVDNNGQALAPRTIASVVTYGATNVEQALNSLIASGSAPYSETSTYALGAYCNQLGVMYKCTTAITSPEAWNAGHWTATNMGAEIVAIYVALDEAKQYTDTAIGNAIATSY